MAERLDAIVVGAGVSGLVAARRLVRAGRQVLVLEARDRVGGRTLSQGLGTDVIDLGGQWLGPTQDRALGLARELGVETFPQFHAGRKLLELGGKLSTYSGLIPSLPVLHLLEAAVGLKRLDWMMRRVPLAHPQTARKAAEWDAIDVEQWLHGALRTSGARSVLRMAVEMIFAAEPREISFLFFLLYLHSGGGLERLGAIRDGAQETRVRGGMQQLSLRLAAELGDRVRLEAPVQSIEHGADGVTVRSGAGVHRAGRVILALAPVLAERIEFIPALPEARRVLQQRMPMGSIVKCIVAYPQPFWRQAGLSGEALSESGLVRAVFDDSAHDGSQSALVAFIAGEAAQRASKMDAGTRKAEVLQCLTRLFGPQAAHCSAYVDKDWVGDPWSGGCYEGFLPPGLLSTAGGALRASVGRVHFAGTESATRWMGYIDGAIEAGERAADEVLGR